VCVSEAGEEPYSEVFHVREFATNYAEGQRQRLGLETVKEFGPDDRTPPKAFRYLCQILARLLPSQRR
jgi:hypothetical protein